MFCKALLCSALQKLNFKINEMGSMLSAYNGFITDFVSMLIWVMAMWLLNCSTILSRVFLQFFCQTVFTITSVFFIRFSISNLRSKAKNMLLQLAHIWLSYIAPLIYIYWHIYIPYFWCFLAISWPIFKNSKIRKNHL